MSEDTDIPIIGKPELRSLLLWYIYDSAAVKFFINPLNISEQEHSASLHLSQGGEERGEAWDSNATIEIRLKN